MLLTFLLAAAAITCPERRVKGDEGSRRALAELISTKARRHVAFQLAQYVKSLRRAFAEFEPQRKRAGPSSIAISH
jgi:hypothetical protein